MFICFGECIIEGSPLLSSSSTALTVSLRFPVSMQEFCRYLNFTTGIVLGDHYCLRFRANKVNSSPACHQNCSSSLLRRALWLIQDCLVEIIIASWLLALKISGDFCFPILSPLHLLFFCTNGCMMRGRQNYVVLLLFVCFLLWYFWDNMQFYFLTFSHLQWNCMLCFWYQMETNTPRDGFDHLAPCMCVSLFMDHIVYCILF